MEAYRDAYRVDYAVLAVWVVLIVVDLSIVGLTIWSLFKLFHVFFLVN
jgi:hypothetical protein